MQNYGQPSYDRPGSTSSFAGQQQPPVQPYQQQQQWSQQPPQQQQPSAPGYNPGTYGVMPSTYAHGSQVQHIDHRLHLSCADSGHSIPQVVSHRTPTPSNRTAMFHLHLPPSRMASQPGRRHRPSTAPSMCRIHRALTTGSSHSKDMQALLCKHSRVATLCTIMLHPHRLLPQLAHTFLRRRVDGQGRCMAQTRLGPQHPRYINGLAALL